MHLDKLIKSTFNTNINIDEFYKNPTLKELSLIIQNKITIDKLSNNTSPINLPINVELAPNQLRFYKQYKIEPFHTNMNIVFSMHMVIENPRKFVDNLKDFLSKLRLFKCRLIGSTKQLKMQFNPHDNLKIEYLTNEVNCKEELLIQEEIERNYYFNLFNESPLRLKIDIHAEKVYLIFNIHHLFFDGASVECLKNSIWQLANNKKVTLPIYDFLDFCKQGFTAYPAQTGNEIY